MEEVGFVPDVPGFIPDEKGFIPDASPNEQFIRTSKEDKPGGFLSKMFRQISQQNTGEVQGRKQMMDQEWVPTPPSYPTVKPETYKRLFEQGSGLLPAAIPNMPNVPIEQRSPTLTGAVEGLANTYAGLTDLSNVPIAAVAALAPEVAAAYFAGTGAKQGGEAFGQASVEAQTGQKKEAAQHSVEGLAALAQMLPAFGLPLARGERPKVSDVPPQKIEQPNLDQPFLEQPSLEQPRPIITPEGEKTVPESAPTSLGDTSNVQGVASPTEIPQAGSKAVGGVAMEPLAEKGRGQFYLDAPEMLEGKGLGFNPEAKVGGGQIQNRLRNKLTPGEYVGLQEAGLEEFLKERRTGKEVAEWVRERGPRVEVKELKAGPTSDIAQKRASLVHELDTKFPGWRSREVDLVRESKEFTRIYTELQSANESTKVESESATARYTKVNPKPLEKMPGAVDLLVRLPTEKGVVTKFGNAGEVVNPKYSSNHYPTEGKNLLAHVRGYMETLPDGKKVFHVFEVQSDWAQALRELQEALNSVKQDANSSVNLDWITRRNKEASELSDPLLKHYERLALKATIDHARKNGADMIAISDADTAMLTEGHDRVASQPIIAEVVNSKGEVTERIASSEETLIKRYEKEGYPLEGSRVRRVEKPYKVISQEKGMRLHYDKTLPKIAEELTGEKGQPVDFGTHQNVLDATDLRSHMHDDGVPSEDINRQVEAIEGGLRSDLLIKNPDGTPKTSITARLYPLSKAKTEFSLFGSDKPTLTKESLNAKSIRSNEGSLSETKGQTGKEEVRRENVENASSEGLQQPTSGVSDEGGMKIRLGSGETGGVKLPSLKEVENAVKVHGSWLMAQTVPRTFAASKKLASALIRLGNVEEHAKHLGINVNKELIARKRAFALAAVDENLGIKLKKGQPVPPGYVGFQITKSSKKNGVIMEGERLALQKNLAGEFRRSFEKGTPLSDETSTKVFKFLTGLQTQLGVDAFTHSGQLLTRLITLERGSGLQSIGGVNLIDSTVRLTRNIYKEVVKGKDFQKEWGQVLEASQPPDFLNRKGPFAFLIRHIDKGGRLAANEMFNELVKAKKLTNTVANREKFISAIGQYNRKLLNSFDSGAKARVLAPFVVAGRAGAAAGLRAITLSPQVAGKNWKVALQFRAQKALGAATTIGILVPLINYMRSGSPFGPHGTPIGAIGKVNDDGTLSVFDAAQLLGFRRMSSGYSALESGIRHGKSGTEILSNMAQEAVKGFIHPYVGPGVDAIKMAATGTDTLGFREADRPGEPLSDLKESGRGLNPAIEALTSSKKKGVAQRYFGSFGFKTVQPTIEDQAKNLAEKILGKRVDSLESIDPDVRQEIAEKLKYVRKPDSLVEQRKRAVFGTRKSLEGLEDIQNTLSKDNQNFMAKHKLSLPQEYSKRGVEQKIASTYSEKEKQTFATILTQKYDEALNDVREQSDIETIGPKGRDQRLRAALRGAYRRAQFDLSEARKQNRGR